MRLQSIVVLSVCLAVVQAQAGVIDVPADQPTIAAAVAVASDGDTIRLKKGRYQEAIVTNRSLKFLGEDGTIWDGTFGGIAKDPLTATASKVSVRNIEFHNGEDPITIIGNDASVTRCRFHGCGNGVVITGSGAEISRNTFEGLDNANTVVEIAGPGARVERNVITNCYYAGISIDAGSAGSATIANNRMENSQDSLFIRVRNASAPKITNNTVKNGYDSSAVIECDGCDDALVSGNRIANVNFLIMHGIYVAGARARVTGNSVEGLQNDVDDVFGIEVVGEGAVITRNRIRSCNAGEAKDSYGIAVTGANARIADNVVVDVGSGSNVSSGIRVTGDDCSIESNVVDGLMDELCYAITVSGQRAAVVSNRVSRSGYGEAITIAGGDFRILRNTLRDLGYSAEAIHTNGSASAPGNARVERNTVASTGYDAFYHVGDGVTFARNRVSDVAGFAIQIYGDGNRLERNAVLRSQNDAFYIAGNSNVVERCVASRPGRDGFDVGGGAGNTFSRCRAIECPAEGLDNGNGTATVVTNCALKGSRIDYAGNNAVANDAGTSFGTGGPATPPEID